MVDFPLRLTRTSSQVWAATMWPDPREPHGWRLEPWQPGPNGRGFVPVGIELGDVVEFGVNHTPRAPALRHSGQQGSQHVRWQVQRWHGYLHGIRADAVLIHGPYPTPEAAYQAAQHSLATEITSPSNGPETRSPYEPQGPRATYLPSHAPSRGVETATPAQPPATVSVTFSGDQATVGDPVHGWIVVDAHQLLTAATHPPEHLHQLLQHHAPQFAAAISGREARLTLAALAAHHLPDIPPPASTATIPDATQPDPTVPDPTAPGPTSPDPTGPDPTGPDPTRPDPTGPGLDPTGAAAGADPTGPDPTGSNPATPSADPPTASL